MHITADYGISGHYVTRLLDRTAIFRGYLLAVRTDNGPEFTSRAFMAWAQSQGIWHVLIEPGRLVQNGYIESFNGNFWDECLNDHWFETLHWARSTIAIWRQDYNEVRPHSSVGRILPVHFAELHRQLSPARWRYNSKPTSFNGNPLTLQIPDFSFMTGMAERGRSGAHRVYPARRS